MAPTEVIRFPLGAQLWPSLQLYTYFVTPVLQILLQSALFYNADDRVARVSPSSKTGAFGR